MKIFLRLLIVLFALAAIVITCRRDPFIFHEPELLDQQAPTVVIQDPTTAMSFAQTENRVTISGIASDNVGLESIKWEVNTQSGIANGLESWTIQDITLEEGDNIIQVTAIDQSQYSSTDEIIITQNRYLTFLGQAQTSPSAIFPNTPTRVMIRVSIAPNAKLIPSSVKLVKLNEDNSIHSELSQLYDDGNQYHGDDNKGDWIFSGYYDFNEAASGEFKIRVVAKTLEGTEEVSGYSAISKLGIYEKLSQSDYHTISGLQDGLATNFINNLIENKKDLALDSVSSWALRQVDIDQVIRMDNGIEVHYSNGIIGGLRMLQENENGNITVKGETTQKKRKPRLAHKVNKQTSGVNLKSQFQNGLYDDIVVNKKVLVWSPFENDFNIDMEPGMTSILNNSDIPFSITALRNSECTVGSLMNMTNYGLIILDTHGSDGREFGTGEEVTSSSFENNSLLLKSKQIGIWKNLYIGFDGSYKSERDVYFITGRFINSLKGIFQNTLVFNGSCESTKTSFLKDAFIEKGASTYFGFNKSVHIEFCNNMAEEIVSGLAGELKTIGQIFSGNRSDTQEPNAKFEMYGNDKMYYSLSLINEDFESVDFAGWNITGDARIISQLGSETPYNGDNMALVSTGLDFINIPGRISQQFKVSTSQTNLSIKWNFLSEEFMEWVGSKNQDSFSIKIITSDKQEKIIFQKSIDDFANDYSLISVSPQIAFDDGDVYMTDWQTFSYDLSSYSGQMITLEISAGDGGDGIFESAILLDKISLE